MTIVVEMNEQIATEQQKNTMGDIENKIISIFDVAGETAHGATLSDSTSSKLLGLATSLKQVLSKFKY